MFFRKYATGLLVGLGLLALVGLILTVFVARQPEIVQYQGDATSPADSIPASQPGETPPQPDALPEEDTGTSDPDNIPLSVEALARNLSERKGFGGFGGSMVASIESGQPIAFTIEGKERELYAFRPISPVTEDFGVALSPQHRVDVDQATYLGTSLSSPGNFMSLAVVGDSFYAVLSTNEGELLHISKNPEGDAFIALRESEQFSCNHAHVEEGEEFHMHGGELASLDEAHAVDIELLSSGQDPVDGQLVLTDRPIPYPPNYDQSLRAQTWLLVHQNPGENTPGNVENLLARSLGVAGVLYTMYENQLGLRWILQEVVLNVNGSDFNSPDMDDSRPEFLVWLDTHRPWSADGWDQAAKFGRVTGANGRATLNVSGRAGAHSINNSLTAGLIGHECGHNLGANHTSGGIMAPSTNGSRDFLTPVDDDYTAADDIYDYMKTVPDRHYGTQPLRNPSEKPFANNDYLTTQPTVTISFDPTVNDDVATKVGGYNTAIELEEVGSVFPSGSGSAYVSQGSIVFTPASGFTGVALFSYSIRGNTGNDGRGWLHKGDVAVRVVDEVSDAPALTVARDTNNRVALDWSFTESNPDSWQIERSVSGGDFEVLLRVDGRTRNWFDYETPIPADNVVYRIAAHDGTSVAGVYGLSNTLLAPSADIAFYDDFTGNDSPDTNDWTLYQANALADTDWNQGTPDIPVVVSKNGDRIALMITNTSSDNSTGRLGLLVSEEYNLNATGRLALSLTNRFTGDTEERRSAKIVAWLDSSGAVIWTETELRTGTRLFAAQSLTEFFAEVEERVSDSRNSLLHRNTEEGGGTWFDSEHRVSFQVSATDVAAALFPITRNVSGNAYSTLAPILHNLNGFTGVGRFAIGGFASPARNKSGGIIVDDVSIGTDALPYQFMPSGIDDYITVPAGGVVTIDFLNNDFGSIGLRSDPSPSKGIMYRTNSGKGGDSTLWSYRADPGASGTDVVSYPVEVDDYDANNDGFTQSVTLHVTIENEQPSAQADTFTYATNGNAVHGNLLLNDSGVGHIYGFNRDAATSSSVTVLPFGNSFRLVSATHDGLGTLELETIPLMAAGVLVDVNTGRFAYTPDASDSGDITINYVIEDANGNQTSGTATLQETTLSFYDLTTVGTPDEIGPSAAVFNISRAPGEPLADDLTLPFQLVGTADYAGTAVDYGVSGAGSFDITTGQGMVTIPAGNASVDITITPFADGVPEGLETVTLIVPEDPSIMPLSRDRATLGILDAGELLNEDFDDFVIAGVDGITSNNSDGWTDDPSATFPWRVGNGSTPSIATGPAGDNTSGAGNYLYTEASGRGSAVSPNDFGVISGIYDLSSVNSAALAFAYHMYGEDIAYLRADVWDGSSWIQVWSRNGEVQSGIDDPWVQGSADISSHLNANLQLRFRGASTSFAGDVSIDDIKIYTSVELPDSAPLILTQPPQNLALITGETAQLAVTANGIPAPSNYQWRKDGTPLSDGAMFSGANSNVLTIINAQPSDAGQYDVLVSNGIGGDVVSASTTLSVMDPDYSAPPTDLFATVVSDTAIDVSWTDNSEDETGFVIERSTAGSGLAFAEIAVVAANQTSFSDSGLLGSTTYFYRVSTRNGVEDSPFSAEASASTKTAARIVADPVSRSVFEGADVRFSVQAIGNPSPVYQWRKGGIDVIDGARFSGATTESLSITGALQADAGDYSVHVTNSVNPSGTISTVASLTVMPAIAPVISVQPVGQSVNEGDNPSLSVVATGNPEPGYQWRKEGIEIPGAVTGTLSFSSVAPDSSGTYDVVVTNFAGSVISDSVTLAVNALPTAMIDSPSGDRVGLPSGTGLLLESTVTDDGPVVIQWAQTSGPGTASFENSASEDTTVTFDTDGTYHLQLNADDGSAQVQDDITVVVSGISAVGYQESGGLVVMEAEDFDNSTSANGFEWLVNTGLSDFTGSGLVTIPNGAGFVNSGYTGGGSPRLDYSITFATTGTYYIWFRGSAPTSGDDSLHASLNDQVIPTADRINLGTANNSNWVWKRSTMDGTEASLVVPGTGLQTFNVYMREDGASVDRIILTTDNSFTPSGMGPAVSERGAQQGPAVSVGGPYTASVADPLSLEATVTDDGLPESPGAISLTWSQVSGPGITSFGNFVQEDTTATMDQPGTYVLRLTASDGQVQTFAQVSVDVTAGSGFAIWAGNQGLSGTAALAGSDPDKDGIQNIFEYAFGLNPMDVSREGLPTVSIIQDSGQRLQIEFSRDSTLTDLIYEVQVSDDLVGWTTIARSQAGQPTVDVGGGSFLISETGTEAVKTVQVSDAEILQTGTRRYMRFALTQQ